MSWREKQPSKASLPSELIPSGSDTKQSFVQKEKHGAFVVEDVDIEFLAAKHGVADRHIDIRIVPRIERIEVRASAEHHGDKHRKEDEEAVFHRDIFFVDAKIR